MDVNKSVTADSFGIDKDLVLEFLVAFSRFEYALKRAGFATGDESQVSANWGSFGMRLRTLSPEQCAPVFQRCKYLQGQPPKKWVLRDGMLRLSDARDASLSDIQQVLISVRRIRNNLFHGGKFPTPDGPVEEVARNAQLIQDSLNVLHAVLLLPGVESVAENFKPE